MYLLRNLAVVSAIVPAMWSSAMAVPKIAELGTRGEAGINPDYIYTGVDAIAGAKDKERRDPIEVNPDYIYTGVDAITGAKDKKRRDPIEVNPDYIYTGVDAIAGAKDKKRRDAHVDAIAGTEA
ncbi:hypothetical protein AUP68_17317 [Ilyonectria robusta]